MRPNRPEVVLREPNAVVAHLFGVYDLVKRLPDALGFTVFVPRVWGPGSGKTIRIS